MLHSLIYLDNSTTSKPSETVINRMTVFYTERWGAPSAPHQKGKELSSQIEESYKRIYELFGAKESDQFVLTSSGAEAINQVFHTAYREITLPTGKNQYLTSFVDEAPSLMASERLEPLGCVSKLVPVDSNGIITPSALTGILSPRTALLSISWGNGLSGIIQPLKEIIDLCQLRGVKLHLDITHAIGKLDFKFEESGVDYITFNGDQIHAPRGVGGLFIRNGIKASSLIAGGLEQGGLRAGHLNVAGLIALAQASREAIEQQDYLCTEIARLRDKLEKGIKAEISDTIIPFENSERLPNISMMIFPGVHQEALLYLLNKKGVCACMGGGSFQQLALILEACSITHSLTHSGLSFALSRYTQENEIDRAIPIIVESVRVLRSLSEDFSFSINQEHHEP